MPDILHQVTIATPPDKVFQALTHQQGLAAWWAPQVVAEPTVGSTIEVRFGDDPFVHTF